MSNHSSLAFVLCLVPFLLVPTFILEIIFCDLGLMILGLVYMPFTISSFQLFVSSLIISFTLESFSRILIGDCTQTVDGVCNHLCPNILISFPFPTLYLRPFNRSKAEQRLLQINEGPLAIFSSSKFLYLKYFSFNTVAVIEFGNCKTLQYCFVSMALLKHSYSLKPIPPSAFDFSMCSSFSIEFSSHYSYGPTKIWKSR